MAIKHSMYTQKVPFLCTERACVVFSGFGICPRRKVTWSKVLQVLWTRGSKTLGTTVDPSELPKVHQVVVFYGRSHG